MMISTYVTNDDFNLCNGFVPGDSQKLRLSCPWNPEGHTLMAIMIQAVTYRHMPLHS